MVPVSISTVHDDSPRIHEDGSFELLKRRQIFSPRFKIEKDSVDFQRNEGFLVCPEKVAIKILAKTKILYLSQTFEPFHNSAAVRNKMMHFENMNFFNIILFLNTDLHDRIYPINVPITMGVFPIVFRF